MSRSSQGVRTLAEAAQDLRLATRRIRRAPALATAIVLTLGLGLGAAGAIFTASDAALVEPLPYAEPDRLVHLGEARAGSDERSPTSYPTLLDWRARAPHRRRAAARRPVQSLGLRCRPASGPRATGERPSRALRRDGGARERVPRCSRRPHRRRPAAARRTAR